MQPLFVNIHTHHSPVNGEWALQSRHVSDTLKPATGLYSVGIHPWYIEPLHWEKQLEMVREESRQSRVLAIGETGLDKACTTAFPLQLQLFTLQVEWANFIGKPLVIHCVRAWEELLAILGKTKNNVPVIFHGYSKNIQLARRLTERGYYISLGKALEQSRMKQVLAAVPADRFFLETDDGQTGIETIYAWAADALSIDHNSLVLQIQQNAETVFGTAIQL